LVVSRRPSVFVLALTVGDYLLWNWSLNANHDVIALIAGLTLPPLALISFWVLALGAMRVLATIVRRPPSTSAQTHVRSAGARRISESAAARAAAVPAGEAAPAESSRIAA
jgi:hypothetical protein